MKKPREEIKIRFDDKITIPDDCLPLNQRSVPPGEEGYKEKLRRDRLVVRKNARKLRES